MRRLVVLVEEKSMQELLSVLLPKLLPEGYPFTVVPHGGRSKLLESVPRKLKAWAEPADFVVMRDQDGADCRGLKAKLLAICAEAGRSDSLVRIVCNELESWFLGDLAAVEAAFGVKGIAKRQGERTYRAPGRVSNAKQELRRGHPPDAARPRRAVALTAAAPLLAEARRLLTRPVRLLAIMLANGARMPSMAEEVATDMRTVRRRTAASHRYGFDAESLQLMELV